VPLTSQDQASTFRSFSVVAARAPERRPFPNDGDPLGALLAALPRDVEDQAVGR
jgi:hypothetical protein